MSKKKIMISQPMRGKTNDEIIEVKNRFLEYAKKHDYEVVNTFFIDEWYSDKHMNEMGVKNIPMMFWTMTSGCKQWLITSKKSNRRVV